MKVSKLLSLFFAIFAIFLFTVSPVIAGGGAEDPWEENEGENGTINGDQGSDADPSDPSIAFESSTFIGSDLWYLGLIWDEIVGSTDSAPEFAPDNTTNTNLGDETDNIAH